MLTLKESCMKKAFHLVLTIVLMMFIPVGGYASSVGTPTTYSNIRFAFSTNISGLTSCTDIRLDGTGDLVNGASFVMSGALNCPAVAGSYALIGSLYFSTNGTSNLNLVLGAGGSLQCQGLVGLSGPCTVYGNNGVVLGTGTLKFF